MKRLDFERYLTPARMGILNDLIPPSFIIELVIKENT